MVSSCFLTANHGGTLTTAGLLFIDRSSWAHVLQEAAGLLGRSREAFLTREEIAALTALVLRNG